MHLYTKKTIQDYCIKYADAKKQLLFWAKEVKDAKWETPKDIKNEDATVSFVGDSRVVFNVNGNKYRLIADINYEKGWVFVIRFLTHADYDKIDVATLSAEN